MAVLVVVAAGYDCAGRGGSWLWAYVPMWVTRCAFAHISMLMRLRSTAGLLSVSLWNALANPVFDGVGPVDLMSRVNAILLN